MERIKSKRRASAEPASISSRSKSQFPTMTVSLSMSWQANEHAVRSHSLVKLCILLTSPSLLGWSYSDIWAKRKAVIRITIRSIIWGGTPENALLAREANGVCANCSCKASICRIHCGSGSGGRLGHIDKLQPRSPQAPATPCLRPLAVSLNWNFHHRFGVPVLASNQIAIMNSAESGYPERSLKSVAVSILNRRKLC